MTTEIAPAEQVDPRLTVGKEMPLPIGDRNAFAEKVIPIAGKVLKVCGAVALGVTGAQLVTNAIFSPDQVNAQEAACQANQGIWPTSLESGEPGRFMVDMRNRCVNSGFKIVTSSEVPNNPNIGVDVPEEPEGKEISPDGKTITWTFTIGHPNINGYGVPLFINATDTITIEKLITLEGGVEGITTYPNHRVDVSANGGGPNISHSTSIEGLNQGGEVEPNTNITATLEITNTGTEATGVEFLLKATYPLNLDFQKTHCLEQTFPEGSAILTTTVTGRFNCYDNLGTGLSKFTIYLNATEPITETQESQLNTTGKVTKTQIAQDIQDILATQLLIQIVAGNTPTGTVVFPQRQESPETNEIIHSVEIYMPLSDAYTGQKPKTPFQLFLPLIMKQGGNTGAKNLTPANELLTKIKGADQSVNNAIDNVTSVGLRMFMAKLQNEADFRRDQYEKAIAKTKSQGRYVRPMKGQDTFAQKALSKA